MHTFSDDCLELLGDEMTFPSVVLVRKNGRWSTRGPIFETTIEAAKNAEYLVRSGSFSRFCVETWSAGSAERHADDLNAMGSWEHFRYQFRRWLNGPVPVLTGGTLPRGIAYAMSVSVLVWIAFGLLK